MRIVKVQPDTLGSKINLKPGDRLLKINGKRVRDEIDYKFKITEEYVSLEFEISGKRALFDIEKEYDVDLGVEFKEFKVRSCANDCVFCFVDQNPEGMRSEMYFRDGDYRLSYLHGHYITMTNMGPKQLNRIVEQRLSPLYISVHTTDIELRHRLFLYKKNDQLLDKIDFLTSNGIKLHAQIVLMPTLNDGDYLIQTIEDIYSFYPGVESLSIVPVGLTKHRSGLMDIPTVNKQYALEFIDQANIFKKIYKGNSNSPFILLSDEWYLMADLPLPRRYDYGELDLVENGVGQVSTFMEKFEIEKPLLPRVLKKPTTFTIGTGTLISDYFQNNIISYLNNEIKNLTVKIVPIKNKFYGEMVTVSGLLTGRDIISQLQDKDIGSAVWFSHRILNDDQTLTLDDMTLENISSALNVPVYVTNDSILDIFTKGFDAE